MSGSVYAAIFVAVLFGLLTPITYPLVARWPAGGVSVVVLSAALGVRGDALLGAMFPKMFAFVLEVFRGW